jgi:predicted Fe-Mo cluster-binding NifX family protein
MDYSAWFGDMNGQFGKFLLSVPQSEIGEKMTERKAVKGVGSKSGKCRAAFAADGRAADSMMSTSLANAAFFIIAEGSPDQTTVIENTAKGTGSTAGIKAAELLVKEKVSIVVTGNIGPKASSILENAHILVHAGCSGPVSKAMTRCLAGKLKETKGASYSGCLESFGTAKAEQ